MERGQAKIEHLHRFGNGHRGNTYLTSLPLVIVRRHGRGDSFKVEIIFQSPRVRAPLSKCAIYVATNAFNERI